MKNAVFVVLLLLAALAPGMAGRAGAQGVDSTCLIPWEDSPLKPHDVVWYNWDSVKVDMCQGSQYLAEFAKTRFIVYFPYYVVPDALAPIGDTLERDWRDIEGKYSDVLSGFDSIERRFGPFTIQHVPIAGDTLGDTAWKPEKKWYVNFQQYENIDSVLYYLIRVPGLDTQDLPADFNGYPNFYESVNLSIIQSPIFIWPQPCISELFIRVKSSSETITFHDLLGRNFTLPVKKISDTILSVNISDLPSEILFGSISQHFFKILIQR